MKVFEFMLDHLVSVAKMSAAVLLAIVILGVVFSSNLRSWSTLRMALEVFLQLVVVFWFLGMLVAVAFLLPLWLIGRI
jgi:hypothetical protein